MILAPLLALVLAAPEPSQMPAQPHTDTATQDAENLELARIKAVIASLRRSLVDPESARITVSFGFTPRPATWTIWGVPTTGLFTCGTVNAKNGFGGYTGPKTFVGVITPDGSVTTTIDSDRSPLLGTICIQALRAGMLPVVHPSVLKALSN